MQKNAMDQVLADMDIDEPSKADVEMFDAEPAGVQKQETKQKDKEAKEKKKDKKKKRRRDYDDRDKDEFGRF